MNNISFKFGEFSKKNNVILVTAESCTAGLIASTVAETSGSSAWLDSGYVVYTPESKNKILEVKYETIEKFNITSTPVSFEMALGAINKSKKANLAISVTGVAGPTGGTDEIPVGTICMSWIYKNNDKIYTTSEKKLFKGSRNSIRKKIVSYVLSKSILLVSDWNGN